jgi:hypothetical protein
MILPPHPVCGWIDIPLTQIFLISASLRGGKNDLAAGALWKI